MDEAFFFTTIGLIPFFISRSFLPLFATALIARFGAEWSFAAGLLGVQLMGGLPEWVVSDVALLVLGLAALVEVVIEKNPELREAIALTDAQLKAALAVVFSVLLVIARQHVGEAAPQTAALDSAGHAVRAAAVELVFLPYLWAVLVGGIVWYGARWRRAVYDLLTDLDPDDDLHLQKFLSWAEDLVGPIGVVFVVVLPVLAAVSAVLAVALLFLVEKKLEQAEKRRELPCAECGEPVLPCAPHCPSCDVRRERPMKVGVLGVIRDEASTSPEAQVLLLLSRRRCSYCGSRLKGRGVSAACPRCARPAFEDAEALASYSDYLRGRLLVTLGVLLLISAVPVAGMFFGVLYYRLTLVASVRQYTPPAARFFGKWLVRFVNLVLLCLQPIPLVGAVALPLMATTNYWLFRRLMLSDADALGRQESA